MENKKEKTTKNKDKIKVSKKESIVNLPPFTGKSKEYQIDAIVERKSVLEEEIKIREIELNELNRMLSKIKIAQQEKERKKRVSSLLEICTDKEREEITKIFGEEKKGKREKKKQK